MKDAGAPHAGTAWAPLLTMAITKAQLPTPAAAARFLKVPTLLLASSRDELVPMPDTEAIFSAIPAKDKSLRVVEAGHFELMDTAAGKGVRQPAAVVEACAAQVAWLQRVLLGR